MNFSSVEWWPSGSLGAFLLFLVPLGPTKTAGILAGKNADLGALALLGLYFAKDVVAALYLEPLLRWLAAFGPRHAWAYKILGTLAARFRLGTGRSALAGSLVLIGLGAGFTSGAVAVHLTPINRVVGWLSLILGDLLWFCVLLAATLGLARAVPDDRVVFVSVLLLTALGGPAARWLRTAVTPRRPAPTAE